MIITSKGRYAVMAMVDLAFAGQGEPISLAEIAQRQDISISYLEQLFAKLRQGGLVNSARGPGGGYTLSASPDDIRLSDIVLAVDDTKRKPLKRGRKAETRPGKIDFRNRRVTEELWDELNNQVHLFLSSLTLSDVINRRVIGSGRMIVATTATVEETAKEHRVAGD